MTSESSVRTDDNFNLIVLFQYYWRKKWWILLSTLLFTFVSYLYVNTIKPEWSSSAEAVPASNGSIEALLDLQQRYSLISNEPFSMQGISSSLFNQFVNNISIIDIRKQYFLESPLYQRLSVNQSDTQKQALLNRLIKSISVITPDMTKKGNNITVITAENRALADIPSVKISFIDNDGQLLQSTLDGFVKYVNCITYQQEIENLLIQIKQKIKALKYQQQQITDQLMLEKQTYLQYLQTAYNVTALVEKNKGNNINVNIDLAKNITQLDNPYLYLLGRENLAAQIEAIQQQNIIYPISYYQAKTQIAELVKLVDETDKLEINTFQYKNSPSFPIKIKPQKSLILAIGVLFGFMFACIILLFIRALKKD
ncbi:LPS O-antigen chain length determinant protein WzzB [Gallibacterium anatis]|uniref:LPS O-antigen chain length determinant protein WzzB n=1 Tax=Gallibacterium anatis TaxID=750 RepID=UPI000BA14EB3|nr:Wzz/FepE/Etk N-terminal domain-containing protein [Gallibacterium anatis]WAX71965.1 Wzz/FepE/Etk N-terminal domain-containing protein [Gallibacterium anatis]